MQGGGHGPASRDFGIGADQVLEAQVVLADGFIVTANPCQHPDLFFAIRGGGGGTYGVVVSTTIKAWPNPRVVTQRLAIMPLADDDVSALLNGIATVYSAYPDLNDAGYSGYGMWAVASPTPLFANVSTGFVHTMSMFDKSLEDAETAFAPLAQKLKAYNGSTLFVSVTYVSYPSHWEFYEAESGIEPPVGSLAVLGSRLLDRTALTSKYSALKKMLTMTAGAPGEFSFSSFEVVSGGQVFKDALDPYSSVHPAWRTSYMNNIVARGWAPGSTESAIAAVYNDITYNKVAAMKELAPNTGCYMNEVRSYSLFKPHPFIIKIFGN